MNFTKQLLVALIALFFANCTSKKLIVCGHRGAMGHATENTLESMKKGIELKADMLEIDVFKIKTGEITESEMLKEMSEFMHKMKSMSGGKHMSKMFSSMFGSMACNAFKSERDVKKPFCFWIIRHHFFQARFLLERFSQRNF